MTNLRANRMGGPGISRNVGERNPRARLTAAAVAAIRAAPSSIPDRELARRYGVHTTTINRARRGVYWTTERTSR